MAGAPPLRARSERHRRQDRRVARRWTAREPLTTAANRAPPVTGLLIAPRLGRHSHRIETAMNEGLPGGTLSVSSESEVEEAHAHVARWIGSQSQAPGCLLDRRRGRCRRALGGTA